MSVLLMRLAGPMQSWGTRSRFTNRDTDLEPSKSGVVGLLCAALGWPRDAAAFGVAGQSRKLEEFARALKMAVRVDREGRLMQDYHTAQELPEDYLKRATKVKKKNFETVLSERFYLADADFLVGLEGERAFLDELDGRLHHPVWPLFLGRKAFVPSLPLSEGVRDGNRIEVLTSWPWRRRHHADKPPGKSLRGVDEADFGKGEPRQDVPLSFVSRGRRFGVRHVLVRPDLFPVPPILEPDQEAPRVS